MKTKPNKVTDRSAKKLSSILAAVISILMGLNALAQGQDLFWTGGRDILPEHAVDGDWTTGNLPNWSTGEFTGGNTSWTDNLVAHFVGTSGTITMPTTVTLQSDITALGINYGSQAGVFLIDTNLRSLTLNGAGIVNNSGTTQKIVNTDGTVLFQNSSTAGNATIINSNSSGFAAGMTNFRDTSTAGNATITNSGVGSVTQFGDNSTAANGIITNSGAASVTEFFNSSTAGNATITNAGANSRIDFFPGSSGGAAALINANSTAVIDISGLADPTLGSIAGNGSFFLGDNNLTLGGNQTSTIFSGVIQDGGNFGGTDGSLTKVGTGVLTLTGVNTYTGATTVNGGVLSISSDANLGTAPGAKVADQLTFNGGTLQATASFTLNPNRGITLEDGGGTIDVTGANTLSYAGINTGTGTSGISGTTGNLTKVGTGTLTLSGRNTYTGTTFVNEGTLNLVGVGGNQNRVINGPLIIGDDIGGTNTAIVIESGAFGTIGGLLHNLTPVTVNSDGLLRIDVENPFHNGLEITTPLVINRGNVSVTASFKFNTLQMIGGSISGSGFGVIDLDGLLTATSDASGNPATISSKVNILTASKVFTINDGPGSTDLLISGVISQDPSATTPVGITKQGTGTLVLSGDNTYTGDTIISTGTLQLGNGGSIVGDVVNNGTFAINHSDMFTFGGVISGTGAFQQLGTGTTVLSGANTYTGSTIVNGGTLMAGAINTLPSQTALTVATGATFNLNNFSQSIGSLAGAGSVTLGAATLITGNDNTSTDFSGVISGLGSLTKMGTGAQTLTGANTYTGGTTISTGTLQLGNGRTSGSIVGRVVDNGTFAVNRSDTFTFNGVISGSGAFAQIGTGTTVLTGANTYTGSTTVDAGALLVDGSLASAQTFVNAGGLLGGSGIIGGDLTNSGIVSPGNSPGTLTVNGNYTQTANGTLHIEVAGLGMNQHDMLVVNGKATLAGTLEVIPLNNFQFQPGNEITFLTAKGGVSGTFKPLENPFLLVSIDQSSIPNSVTLEVLAVSAPPPFVSIFNGGVSLANIYSVNLLRQMDYRQAGGGGLNVTINGSNFNGGLAGPTGPEGKSGPSVMQPTPENRWGVFVTGLGEFTDVDSTSNAPGFNLTTGGLTFGADYLVSPNFAIGLTGGYAHTNSDFVNGSVDVNGGTIGAYATGFGGGFYVNAAAFGVFNSYDTHRTALLGTASGETDGQDFNALVAAGYDWKHGGLTIGPLASFQYTYVGLDGFTEHGSVAPLSFSNQNAESTRTALGAKASYDWHVGQVVVKPELRAAWQHEFGDTEYSIVSRLANGAGNSFTVNGPAIGRDSLLIGAGAAVLLNDRVSVYAYYDGELARTNYSSNNVSAGLRITF